MSAVRSVTAAGRVRIQKALCKYNVFCELNDANVPAGTVKSGATLSNVRLRAVDDLLRVNLNKASTSGSPLTTPCCGGYMCCTQSILVSGVRPDPV